MKLKRYLSAIIIVVITLALLVGCDDSSITYGREYKITEFSAFADMTVDGTDKIEIYYAENNADITFTIKDADTIDDLMLSQGAETVNIFIKMAWLPKFPYTYIKKYINNLRSPNNGPLSEKRNQLKQEMLEENIQDAN